MPALKPTDHYAEITWLGAVEDHDRKAMLGIEHRAIDLGWDGIPGSVHGGTTRPACSRTKAQHPPGTEIRNVRQLAISSEEELAQIAQTLDLALDQLDPARLGTSMVLRGIPDFSHVPPSSRLQSETGATLVVDMENRPCNQPGLSLETAHPGHGKGFKPAARGLRGVTAWVERPGPVKLGDKLRLHVPDQPPWRG